MSLNLADVIRYSARHFGGETALIDGGRRLTYRELSARVEAFAAHLRSLGVEQGDKVALLLPNSMSFTIGYFGILHAGATVVPINFLSVAREIAYALNDSQAVALVAWSEYAEHAGRGHEGAEGCRHLLRVDESSGPLTILDGKPIDLEARSERAPTGAEDTAVILYTSGTTGEPKGAELTHFNMYSNAQYSADRILWTPTHAESLGPGNVTLAALPLFHSFGQTCNQNATLTAGGALTYMRRFDAEEALAVMARDDVTLFSGVPTMYFQLLQVRDASRHDLSRLRFCFSGGAAMPVEVMKEFEGRYGVQILEGYGLSETSPVATFNVLYKERKPGSIGEPIYGCDVRVFDDEDRELPAGAVGEIVIRGFNVMKGYYRRTQATAEAFRSGWFHSGDMGRKDEDGYIYIVDRKKDMIIRGGFNVYPREVEEVLYGHPAVREAAVVGVPDPEYGEEVKAFVALKDGPGAQGAIDGIRRFCRENLSATKYPRLFEVLPDLPKGPTGKILRKELRQRARGEGARK
jgi:long-chain acyl-CoA synthetase